jgi:hypothetical protein
LPKKYITKLGCEKYVVQGHILSTTTGDLLLEQLHQQQQQEKSSLHNIFWMKENAFLMTEI